MLQVVQTAHYLEEELAAVVAAGAPLAGYVSHQSHDGMWVWDLEAPQNVWVSPEFWLVLGYDPSDRDHRAEALAEVVWENDRVNFPASLLDADVGHNGMIDRIVHFTTASGALMHFRCRGTASRREDGAATRMLLVLEDLSPLFKMIEFRELAGLYVQLAEKSRQTDDFEHFMFGMSHDMLSPLNVASSALKEIKYELEVGNPEEAHDLLDLCEDSLARMTGLLKSMRSYFTTSKPDETYEAAVSLVAVAKAARGELAQMIESSRADVHLDCPHRVAGSATQLQLLLKNLLSNAIKFSGHEGAPSVQVQTRLLPGGKVVRLSVMDNGVGIDKKHRRTVFHPFKRLHRNAKAAGSGLGLSICKRIASNHGTTVEINALPEGGTEVYIDLHLGEVQ
jgi:signal transduction histidine kinase